MRIRETLEYIPEYIAEYYTLVFWLLFTIAGALVISSAALATPLLDLALGLVLVALGLHKLYEETHTQRREEDKRLLARHLGNINTWLSSSHAHSRRANTRNEYRISNLDKKRADLDKKIEKNYRELVRKIIELENELNKLKKTRKAYKPR